VHGGDVSDELVFAEHVEESGLTGIIETEEDKVGLLARETKIAKMKRNK
jgi:hypothetical protein